MKWRHIPGYASQAPLSISGDYVISHRPERFTVSYRPEGVHEHVGVFPTLKLAKEAAVSHRQPNSFQFFTTDGRWFPIDHFFYAPCMRDKTRGGGFVEKGIVVHLETHANIQHPNGWSVSVIQGEGSIAKVEEYDDIPSALRRMAEIIEEHSNGK